MRLTFSSICAFVACVVPLVPVSAQVEVATAPSTTEKTAYAIREIIINAREQDDKLIITIKREKFSREALLDLMKLMLSLDPNLPVRIRGDSEMSWKKIADVISTCSEAGVWNISFSKKTSEKKAL